MEESKNTSNSKIDLGLTDSWTIVNSDDSEVNVKAEIGETSDSESLEVLEVEKEESEQNCQEDLQREENCHDECTKDCDDSFLLEDPLIHLAAIQKVRKYVHHPSAYINMWLSVVMVIAIAVTLGLGVGHYLGSKRFARAKDLIHHLKYENQMLEQELSDVTMKNKHCESDLHSRVRQLVVESKQSELSDSYCTSYNFQDIYTNLIHGHDEDVCYAEENPLFAKFFKQRFVNNTLPPFLHWISYINDGEQALDFPFENEFTVNRSYIITKNSDNISDVELLSELEVINNKMHSNKSHIHFPKLTTQLTYLHSLLKKWNEFNENLKLPASDSKTEDLGLGLQSTERLSEVTHKVMPVVSGNSYKVPNETVKSRLANSSNGFCRSKINQCILFEEKLQKKEKKCYALTKAQLLCSLLQRSKKKQGNNSLSGKQKTLGNKDKKPSIPNFSFEQKRYRKVENIKISDDKKKGKGENGIQASKVPNYSKLDSKRSKKIDKMENSSKNVGSKEKNHKFKYNSKSHISKKEKKHLQTKKQVNSHLQHQKKQLYKPITKYKQFKTYDFKENCKNKDIMRDNNVRKYMEKMNRKNADKFKQYYNDQRQCKFHKNSKKLTENKRYSPHFRFDFSKKSDHDYEKFSSTENAKRNIIRNFKKCSSDDGHCKDKKTSEDKKHYTHFYSSGKSYQFKTQSYEKKNDSENASCKYSSITHKKDKDFPKYWKERSKVYDLQMQELKIFKT